MRVADDDDFLRAAALAFVERLNERTGGRVASRDLQSFIFNGLAIPLIEQRGIRTPQGYAAALTIRTTYRARPEDLPYQDAIGEDGYPRYKWRGDDPDLFDNRALREAMLLGKPVIWLRGIASGVYQPVAPVWLTAEEPSQQQFVLALDPAMREQWDVDRLQHPADLALHRKYAGSARDRLRDQRTVPAVRRVRQLHDPIPGRRQGPSSRSSASSRRTSSVLRRTPRTGTRSARRTTCSTPRGHRVDERSRE